MTDSETPDISKHSRLEYYSFAQHWRSKNFISLHNLAFTCFVIMTSDSSYSWYFLNSDRSVLISLILDDVESNLDWYSRASLIISSLPSFLSAASLSTILINKLLKVTYYNYYKSFSLRKYRFVSLTVSLRVDFLRRKKTSPHFYDYLQLIMVTILFIFGFMLKKLDMIKTSFKPISGATPALLTSNFYIWGTQITSLQFFDNI